MYMHALRGIKSTSPQQCMSHDSYFNAKKPPHDTNCGMNCVKTFLKGRVCIT